MQIAQIIITEIIRQIKIQLGNGLDGAGIAIKDIKGQVVTLDISESGERIFLGLDDTKGSYFYIRLTGNTVESAVTGGANRRGSCGREILTRAPFKLVAMHRCNDPKQMLEAFKFALLTCNFNGFTTVYNIGEINIRPVSSTCIPWDIYTAETGKDATTLQSNLQIVSIDFNLEFQLTYSDKCTDFKIC